MTLVGDCLTNLPNELREYVRRISPPDHKDLVALRERTSALPFVALMQGSPEVGHLLQFLIRLTKACNILEVGVFTGCSTLAMAMAIPPNGRVVAVDVSEKWPTIGRGFWTRSGFADRIDLRIGCAIDVMDRLIDEGRAGTFDLAFIDADKDAYEGYFERSLVLLRENGVMVFDNILFGGRVQPSYSESDIRLEDSKRPKSLHDLYIRYVEALRRFNDALAHDARVDVAVLPLVDGVTLARKR